jgi:hypothetical protein
MVTPGLFCFTKPLDLTAHRDGKTLSHFARNKKKLKFTTEMRMISACIWRAALSLRDFCNCIS